MPNMNTPLPGITPGNRPKVLFLGNGINLCWNGTKWSDIISGYASESGIEYDKAVFDKLPATLQIVAATGDHVNSNMSSMAETLLSAELCDEHRSFLGEVLAIPFDQIITTNYTYELEKTIEPRYSRGTSRFSTFYSVDKINRSNDLMLHRFTKLPYAGADKYVWHIHGIAYKPSSIIIGHYYYGKLVSQIQSYVGKMMSRYKTAETTSEEYKPLSWIDYFMLGDVYMLGFGLDPAEFDIWWLACCKKRNSPNSKICYYSKETAREQELLLNAYGLKKVSIEADGYLEFYRKALEKIKTEL